MLTVHLLDTNGRALSWLTTRVEHGKPCLAKHPLQPPCSLKQEWTLPERHCKFAFSSAGSDRSADIAASR